MNATRRMTWPGAVLALLLAGCSDDPTGPGAPPPCGADEVRDESGACVAAAPTCRPDAPGSLASTCAAAHRECFEAAGTASCTLCLPGHVEEGGTCRPVRSCADLDCSAEHRTCVEAGARADAQCGSCLPGTEGVPGGCMPRTCEPGVPGSLAESCAVQKRTCTEADGEEAACGACWPGFVDRGGACLPVRTCADLGCGEAGRSCTPASANRDASCGPCRAGQRELGSACVPLADATCGEGGTDIAAACAAESRHCEPGTPARCGGCLDGTVADPDTHACVEPITCEALGCEAEHRSCASFPTGRCTGCLPGFTEDPSSGRCRPVRTCAQVACAGDEICLEPEDHADATCRRDCGDAGLWNGSRCEPCPPCDDEGEDGRWPSPTAAGACICRTQPGHFYSTAGDVGTFSCDADGDGWVRESARLAIESSDPALRTNARCDLRSIDRVVLVNEAGERRTVPLSQPLPLYESDRNDDDTLLAITWQGRGWPAYGPGGTLPSARELNRMTKICHDPRTDYNDNGVPDVNEWNGHARAPTVRPEQAAFNQFSYFVELHTGRWIPPPAGGGHGAWEIREKSRLEPAGGDRIDHVSISYPAGDGSHWRTCDVDRDPRYGVLAQAVGLDFAAHSDPAQGWSGMNHHSQFKCMVFENEPVVGLPQQITPADAAARGYRLNRCRAAGPARTPPDGANPAETDVVCSPLGSNGVRPGDVAWAAVPYVDYGPQLPGSSYQGGCVNDCILQLPRCPSYDVNPAGVSCFHDAADFGRFLGCDAFEICDGLDNDLDGVVDNGNPGGGLPCATGEPGVCAQGTTVCRDGAIQCDRNVQPSAETCNGLDDNCDGSVDETYPEQGQACAVPGLLGECAKGVYTCTEGGLECVQVNQPTAESCDGLDNNCDGAIDEGEDNDGCTDYYLDEDGDGWGLQSARKCLCAPDTANKYVARAKHRDGTVDKQPFAFDCCDRDNRAFPGATSWRTAANACGSFDYDCDGVETKQSNTAVAAGCSTCCGGFCCCSARVGWANAVPACGQNATWYINDCSNWSACRQEGEQRTLACR